MIFHVNTLVSMVNNIVNGILVHQLITGVLKLVIGQELIITNVLHVTEIAILLVAEAVLEEALVVLAVLVVLVV